MTGQTIGHLVAHQWVERLDADDAEVHGVLAARDRVIRRCRCEFPKLCR